MAQAQREGIRGGAERFKGSTNVATPNLLVANHQGSIVAYANYSGVKQAIYTYGPWGEPTDEVGNANWTGPRFRYTGQVALPEVRLYYYKARVYDPVMGRFLQTDPIGSKDDLNLYAYVGGDPVNHVDPTGLACGLKQQDEAGNCHQGSGGLQTFRSEGDNGGGGAITGGPRVWRPSGSGAPSGTVTAPGKDSKGKGLFGLAVPAISAAVNVEYRRRFVAARSRFSEAREKGYNIAYHYTDILGADGIALTNTIFSDSRRRTYFTFAAMGPQQANDTLIMGADYGKPSEFIRGSYVVIMAMDPAYPYEVDPSTMGVPGFYTTGPIKNGSGAYFLYVGPNFFPNGTPWTGQ